MLPRYLGLLPRLAAAAAAAPHPHHPQHAARAAAAWAWPGLAGAPLAGAQRGASGLAAAAPAARGLVRLRYLLGLGGLAAAAQFDALRDEARLGALAVVRLARDVSAAAAIVADYKVSLASAPPSGPERAEALAGCHERGADRLLRLCFANGGIYTKLGQHIGQLDHLLPSQYVVTMREHLLDKCPVSDYAEVAAIIREDLGSPPEELFASFDTQPIASASLAQVHRATGLDGRPLAIKVQHAGLAESCAADIRTIELLVQAARGGGGGE
ncbi:hypothetical protein Rsub_01925 [Raphidocelis subcapitata]|uniref:ABC1 atypical kinase-like domain-containing protein n=1 Tax=Raphidocelis subcapitata TaxID=307507 RepID=A0A2V0NNP8_9CHLO|nr:hypothetical protein Rsub_01925 [Raphidocelis subcapitata]|eukprot:GBF89208.1 hypothetical protein Rsub_01925 [Raphidocelis subcapitata]